MSDIANILLVRNKFPSQTMIAMANELDIALACTRIRHSSPARFCTMRD
jgi:hypothetical protein